eukprot:Seg1704.10 transcript_id=Seg1704.10/GoldUCD/mRNA.D3Y31 product="Threonine synthase-like 2" protein_id=Seg1704.10/GoldUCD/D3Y31
MPKTQFQSTRGSARCDSFQDIILSGYAPDGGMFLPEKIPKLSLEDLVAYSMLDYVNLCREIVKQFTSEEEYAKLNLSDLIEEAFATFDCQEIVPVRHFGNVYVAELWHGRTMAFKDLAISCLSRFTENILKESKRHVNIICPTSGDTGSAIMQSVRGSKHIDIFTLFPDGRCSEIQERQMICIEEKNVHAICAEGTSDDFDCLVQELHKDIEFVKENNLISFSSLNFVRIMIQIVHYFFAYFKAVDIIGDLITVVVPCGGLGNITAGYIAHLMGLPINLVGACNQNDAFHQILSKGVFREPKEVLKSTSCSMDIMVPYNIERLFYLAGDQDGTTLKIMQEFKNERQAKIPESVLTKLRKTIQTASVSETEVREAMKKTWERFEYHIEPHTAVAVAIALSPDRYGVKLTDNKVVCLSCASPQKFPDIFAEEGIPLEQTEEVKALLKKPKRFEQWKRNEDWIGKMKDGVRLATKQFKES